MSISPARICRLASFALCFSLLTFFSQESTGEQPTPKHSYSWTQVTNHASWPGRAMHGTSVFNNKLWVLGGMADGYGYTSYNDIWDSTDGVSWTQAVDHAAWSARFGIDALILDDKLWILGGSTSLGPYLNDVWSSENGSTWVELTASAAWQARSSPASVVFLNKLWMMGGDSFEVGNDVWSSPDGVNWDLSTQHAPWIQRWGHSAVVFDGKLWVLAGGARDLYIRELNDVWCTQDGANWIQITEHAPWPARSRHSAVVYDNKIWILGGQYTEGSGHQTGICFRNDIWYSANGETWTQVETAPWSARSGHKCESFGGRLWLTGGENSFGQVLNDVWYMESDPCAAFSGTPVSGDAPLAVDFTDESTGAFSAITDWAWDFGDGVTSGDQDPSHTYTVRGLYTVSLTVTSDAGEDTEIKDGYITVYGAPHDFHTADQDQDNDINLAELLRVIQFYNSDGFHCAADTEDGYTPGSGDDTCVLHDGDYAPLDWQISMSELLRVIQFYNAPGYESCPDGEDGFCVVTAK